jgi:hypothetical protein
VSTLGCGLGAKAVQWSTATPVADNYQTNKLLLHAKLFTVSTEALTYGRTYVLSVRVSFYITTVHRDEARN